VVEWSLWWSLFRSDSDKRAYDGRTNQASPNSKAEGTGASGRGRSTHGIGSALECQCSVQAAGFRHRCTRCRSVRLRFWRARRKRRARAPASLCALQWQLVCLLFHSSARLSARTGGHCVGSFPQQAGPVQAMFSSLKIQNLALCKKKIPHHIKFAVHAWSTKC